MRELLELVGEFLLEWAIYKLADFFYGTKDSPAPKARIVIARVISLLVFVLAATGLAFANGVSVPLIVGSIFNQTLGVVFVVFCSVIWGLTSMTGEHQLGNKNVSGAIILVGLAMVGLGIATLIRTSVD